MGDIETIPLPFDMSPAINELALALSKAQGAVSTAKKDSANPFFKSKYADLSSIWDACRKPLADNGLSVVQMPGSNGTQVSLTTILLHASGQYISNRLVMNLTKDNGPQAVGSAITYARRYALAAFVGICPDDDDGNAAQGRPHQQPQQPQQRPPFQGNRT